MDAKILEQNIMDVIYEARKRRNSSSTSVLSSVKVAPVQKVKPKEKLQVEPPKHAKRVTFSKVRKAEQPTPTQHTTVKESEAQTGLTSCLITNAKANSRAEGGANNPAERKVGWLARTDSECQFKAPGLDFLTDRDTNVTTFEVKMRDSLQSVKDYTTKCDYFPKFIDNRPYKDQATQTLYRESSAQTVAYLPDIKHKEENEHFELFNLATLLPGDKPPGLYEVEILERARKRWAFNKALKTNFRKQLHEARELSIRSKYRSILEAFEWEQWIEREEYIQECQMMRLEIVIRMFDKREKEMHTASKTRIETACESIEQRRQRGLTKNEIEYQRAMRRLQIKNSGMPRRWKKQSPMYALGSPCSEFYGPLIRHGVDPARRSFVGDGRKAFDMRIDDLEKRVNMDKLQCPFTKLKEWSKPKEYVKEYEQNFCSDKHLQKLYESLKTLRSQETKQKTTPKCLKRRHKGITDIDRRASYNYEYTDVEDFFKSRARKTEMPAHALEEKLSAHQQLALHHRKLEERWRKTEPEKAVVLLRERRFEDLEHLMHMYEGSTIGWIMQFLSEEMERLIEQRKLHFFSILAQKERWRREAAEAGLRQKENDMRLLYEDMFQQSNLVHNEVTEDYINTILTTDMAHVAECKAEETVVNLAKQIDKDIQYWLESFKCIQSAMTYEPLRYMLRDMIFPDFNALLIKYEKSLIVKYILDDVIFSQVWEKMENYDISSTLTSDLIDRLIDNDLYLFSTDSESDTPHRSGWQEAEAIIRKIIRQAVPGRRWKTETERIVTENYNDLLDDVFCGILENINRDPPVIDPISLRNISSQRTIKQNDNFRFIQQLIKIDSVKQEAALEYDENDSHLRTEILSLLKKKKTDNVTKDLITDEIFIMSDDKSKDWDKLINMQIFNKADKSEQEIVDAIFGVFSTLDFARQQDFTHFRKDNIVKIPKEEVEDPPSTISDIGVMFDTASQTKEEDQLIGVLTDIVGSEEISEYEADDEGSTWQQLSESEGYPTHETRGEEEEDGDGDGDGEGEGEGKVRTSTEEEEEEKKKIELLEAFDDKDDARAHTSSYFQSGLRSKSSAASGNISIYDLNNEEQGDTGSNASKEPRATRATRTSERD